MRMLYQLSKKQHNTLTINLLQKTTVIQLKEILSKR